MATDSAHHGASRIAYDLFLWHPPRLSADDALLSELPTLTARIDDLIRNSGLLTGGVHLASDTIVGTGLRLSAKPAYQLLGQSADWAAEWSADVEERFRAWATDPDHLSDAGRRLNFAGRLAQVTRSLFYRGQALAIAEWRPDRRPDAYSTCLKLIDPIRLCTPPKRQQDPTIRAGIRFDQDGGARTYYFSNALHRTDRQREFRAVPAFTPWGRRRVLHVFDPELPEQSQGKSPLATSITRMRKLDKWEDATLEAALFNALYTAAIESDLESVMEALGGSDIDTYAQQIANWTANKAVKLDGIRVPRLFPGEKLMFNRPEQPNAAFGQFEDAFFSHFAAALGLSQQQLSRNYANTSFSGAQAGKHDAWRRTLYRRALVEHSYASQEYALWLEEAVNRGDVPIPAGAPSFYEAKPSWTRCSWIGPGQKALNALQEEKAREVQYNNGVLTLEEWCAVHERDWEAVLEQRAREMQRREALGVPVDNPLTLADDTGVF